ncbi:hypothetical protein [Kaistella jeonii]|uniref:Uncharacterized protein n=1 Tax=Kaistella jeonii TaxID=266749 RepID=A0A0C1FFW5_9FLAO|nr:hypothetical protein [Kaistella jeonii]KIA90693.1 hypothetical protein OA86_02125 [Kaistella jeonii]SFB69009.1 hypothetical protein SAMN05421876_10194 [Kaistella jeonii]VEI94697.1 Uncharacterised protein [Kaistella jeonii]
MKLTTENAAPKESNSFYTGVKSLIDRKIGGINILSNHQILQEKEKLNNMRNGKVLISPPERFDK